MCVETVKKLFFVRSSKPLYGSAGAHMYSVTDRICNLKQNMIFEQIWTGLGKFGLIGQFRVHEYIELFYHNPDLVLGKTFFIPADFSLA